MSDRIAGVNQIDDDLSLVGLSGPLVIEAGTKGEKPEYQNVANRVVLVSRGDDEYSIHVENPVRVNVYDIDDPKEFKFDVDSQKITFEIRGTIYKVRPFEDEDGLWASAVRTAVPARILEEIFMSEVELENGTGAAVSYKPEELYALLNGDDEVVYLVYSGANQTFLREDGEWAPLDDPTGDKLDDLYIEYVEPEFVEKFDKKKGKNLSAEDLVIADDVVTASAATGFKFASVINKKD